MTSYDAAQNLRTICIRKNLTDATILPHFPVGPNNHKEHFVQLNVILDTHYHHYQKKEYGNSVRILMKFRDHFNKPDNVFYVNPVINALKEKCTQAFLNNVDPPAVTQQFRNYILEASLIARPFIRQAPGITADVLLALEKYIDWLRKL